MKEVTSDILAMSNFHWISHPIPTTKELPNKISRSAPIIEQTQDIDALGIGKVFINFSVRPTTSVAMIVKQKLKLNVKRVPSLYSI